MGTRIKYGGFCATCMNDSTCTLPRAASLPVESCEQYAGDSERIGKTHEKRNAGDPPADSVGRAMATAQKMGLCATCESRDTCNFPQARRGVQYCEEFR